MHPRSIVLVLGALILTGNSCFARQLKSISKLWSVHVDEVDSSQSARFEQLVGAQFKARNTILKEHNISIKLNYEIVTGGLIYMRFIPRTSFAELDQPPKFPDEVKQLLKARVNVMDDEIHVTLRTHHNELWQFDEESSYLPESVFADGAMPKFIHVHSEWVTPGKSGLYDSIMTLFHDALKTTRHPLACLVFYSSYGDGSYQYFWHAENKEQFVHSSTQKDIFVAGFGLEEGSNLFDQLQGCLIKSMDIDASSRQDLLGLEEELPWFGISREN